MMGMKEYRNIKIDAAMMHRRSTVYTSGKERSTLFANLSGILSIEKINNTKQLESLHAAWNDLLKNSDVNNIFLTWEWLSAWWKHLRGSYKLHLLAVWENAQLIAIAPFVVKPAQTKRLLPFRSVAFMGMRTVGTDYVDIIIRNGKEEVSLEVLAAYLSKCRLMFELKRVKSGTCMALRLGYLLQNRGWHLSRAIAEICPYVLLEGHTWESYLSSLGSSHRQNVRRCMRRINRDFSVEVVQVKTEAERIKYLEIFETLHHKRWDTKSGSDIKSDFGYMKFHNAFSCYALDNRWLRLFVLLLDGNPAAAIYGFRYQDEFIFYQSGFDPKYSRYSVGLVLMALSIKSMLREGISRYDMLHGTESYKYLWTKEQQDLILLKYYPPSILGLIARYTYLLRDMGKPFFHRITNRYNYSNNNRRLRAGIL